MTGYRLLYLRNAAIGVPVLAFAVLIQLERTRELPQAARVLTSVIGFVLGVAITGIVFACLIAPAYAIRRRRMAADPKALVFVAWINASIQGLRRSPRRDDELRLSRYFAVVVDSAGITLWTSRSGVKSFSSVKWSEVGDVYRGNSPYRGVAVPALMIEVVGRTSKEVVAFSPAAARTSLFPAFEKRIDALAAAITARRPRS